MRTDMTVRLYLISSGKYDIKRNSICFRFVIFLKLYYRTKYFGIFIHVFMTFSVGHST